MLSWADNLKSTPNSQLAMNHSMAVASQKLFVYCIVLFGRYNPQKAQISLSVFVLKLLCLQEQTVKHLV